LRRSIPCAILLVAPALEEDQLAGALVGPGEQVPGHHHAGAAGKRLDDVAGVADAAVGDDGHVASGGRLRTVEDRGDHRDADAGDHAGRADGSSPDADLHRIDAGVDERCRGFGGGDVAGNQIGVRELAAEPGDGINDALIVTVRGVHHEHVHAGRNERTRTLDHVL